MASELYPLAHIGLKMSIIKDTNKIVQPARLLYYQVNSTNQLNQAIKKDSEVKFVEQEITIYFKI